MPSVSMRQLLEAGVHFGHQTRRWNPKMRPYIFAERNGIHIIDLAQTVQRLDVALDFVRETVARGDQVLFVGTKKQAQEPVLAEATRADMPYVNKRWLGGMLTNFVTIKKRIGLLDQLEARQAAGDFERMTKKEAAKLTEEMNKLQGTLGGMRKMKRLPGAMFVDRPAPRAHRGDRGEQARDPGRRHRRHQRRPRRARLHHPRQRRRDPRHPAAVHARRRGRDRGRPGARDARGQRARDHRARGHGRGRRRRDGASDELVAALAGGGALSFEPDPDEDDLLPGDRARAEAAVRRRPRRQPKRPPRRSRPSLRAKPPRRPKPTTPAEPAAACPRSPCRLDRQTPLRAPDAPRTEQEQEHTHPWRTSRRSGQGTPRAHRRRDDGLQERARARPAATSRRRSSILRERGLAAAAKKVEPRGPRGPRLQLHPHRWPGRRAHRGQLRDGLRRPHRASSRSSSRTSPCRSPGWPRCTSTASRSRPPSSKRRRPSCWPTRTT